MKVRTSCFHSMTGVKCRATSVAKNLLSEYIFKSVSISMINMAYCYIEQTQALWRCFIGGSHTPNFGKVFPKMCSNFVVRTLAAIKLSHISSEQSTISTNSSFLRYVDHPGNTHSTGRAHPLPLDMLMLFHKLSEQKNWMLVAKGECVTLAPVLPLASLST